MARFGPIPGQILGKSRERSRQRAEGANSTIPGKFHNGLFKLCHEDAYKKQTAGIKPPLTLKPVNTGAFCHTIGGKHNLENTQ